MSGEPDGDSSLIDRVADRFERAWLAGEMPLIEQYLDGTAGARRTRLFDELLHIERELRARVGSPTDVEDYRRRFPDLVEIIERIFAAPTDPLATQLFVEGGPTTVIDLSAHGQAASAAPAAGSHDGRFRVLHHHADGGIGRVSVALDCELHRHVAVKELQEQFADDPRVRQRFMLEVQVTGRLEHPGVVPVYSLGCDRHGRPFYAMRFIEGEDLDRAIKNFHAADATAGRDPGQRTFALRHLLRRFIDVCNVVAYAHSRGVLHRDLKPANVLLGPYGETLVVDWGMAKLVDGTLALAEIPDPIPGPAAEEKWDKTQEGTILGTIPYMSPEQAGGDAPGTASDVYSLGATLYHIITGRPPIAKDEVDAMLRCARQGEIKPPRQVNLRVPPALAAVCQKAMSIDPNDRYPSPRALADEIEHWLADEPVTAWREPWLVRSRRWIRRHRTPFAAVAAGLAVGVISLVHLLNDYHLRSVERRARAQGLVVALSTAEVREVGEIVHQLHPLRWLVLEKLKSMAQPGPDPQANRRRNAALALLADDAAHTEYLIERITREEVHPHEICVVREALLEHGQASLVAPRLWRLLAERAESGAPNLGAAGALARFAPEDPRWAALAAPVAAGLVMKSPSLIGEWREVFQPVQRILVGPLRAILGDIARPGERALAFSLLEDFAMEADNSNRDRDLAELIADASPDEFREIRRALKDRGKAVSVLLATLNHKEPLNENAARRRGRVAACLIALQSADRAWPVLRVAPSRDPGERTELIHDLAAYGVPQGDVAGRLFVETDISARRALILALGEYAPPTAAEPLGLTLVDRLLDWYAADPDPGIHAAIDWLFRTRWGLGPRLDALDAMWRRQSPAAGRNWFVNNDGETMAIVAIDKPVDFEIGSPEDEDGRDSDEPVHAVRLGQSFAIATREVSRAQFERFRPPGAPPGRSVKASVPATCEFCPVVGIDWLTAAEYCNWLSRRENLEPYYVIQGDVVSVPNPGGLGYRLPSEAEWEYACRSGTRSSRPQGSSVAFLDRYGWFIVNASKHTHPVGTLKPNDLGLFDMLGNAFEWTGDRYTRDAAVLSPGSSANSAGQGAVARELEVVLRGGSFSSPATALRSAYREYSSPSNPLETYGFRYVRTMTFAGENRTGRR